MHRKLIPLNEMPQSHYFCDNRKYLKLCTHYFSETSSPIIEDNSYFLLVKAGYGHIIINGLSFELKAGVVCWIQCSQVVTIDPAVGEALIIQSIVYDYVLSNFLMFRAGGGDQRTAVVARSPVMNADRKAAQRIAKLFGRFEVINAKIDYGTSLMKVALLGRMSLEFASDRLSLDDALVSSELFPAWWAAVYISMHSREEISAEFVAQELSTDTSTMNCQLRAVTGMGFEQMLCRSRCILAASFFMYENMTFDYIAVNSGFKTQLAFFRSFKRTMGMTASEYRDANLCEGKAARRHIYRGMIMDDRLIAILKYLYQNYTEQISLRHMANETFISENIIKKLLNDSFALSYKDILYIMRVRNAEAMLSTSQLHLLDIAVLSGFNNISTFERQFKQINGMSPSAFRELCREGECKNEWK